MASRDEWEIVKARIEAMPQNLKLSIGDSKSLTRDELLEHIEKRDDIGKMLVEMHLNYLRSFKEMYR